MSPGGFVDGSMKTAILSDIHGNLPALKVALKDAEEVDNFIILGDVVNYGPWSNECVELLESIDNCQKIIGNHEEYFIRGVCSENNTLVREFFGTCYKDFSEFSAIKAYQNEVLLDDFVCTHTIDNRYIFHDSKVNLDRNYIVGHSHQSYIRNENDFLIMNPGSVGQNRQFINEINYLVYDSSRKEAEIRKKLFDVDVVINEMKKKNYPPMCIDYYQTKSRK